MRETIQELKALREKATPTPWQVDNYGIYIWGPNMEMIADNDDEEAYLLRMRGVGAKLPIEANRNLIVETVNKLPELLAYIDELERKVAAYEKFVEAVEGRGSTWCDGKHHENINGACAQDVEDQINKAFATLKKESL